MIPEHRVQTNLKIGKINIKINAQSTPRGERDSNSLMVSVFLEKDMKNLKNNTNLRFVFSFGPAIPLSRTYPKLQKQNEKRYEYPYIFCSTILSILNLEIT